MNPKGQLLLLSVKIIGENFLDMVILLLTFVTFPGIVRIGTERTFEVDVRAETI